MKLSRLGQVLIAGWLFSGLAQAAEVQVLPGNGTLAAAVLAAADGDTLVLSDGTYVGNGDLVIDKSLTIRAINSAVDSLVTGGTFTIDAADSQVILQGVDFGVAVNVLAAADVKVLEGSFYNGVDLNVTAYATTEGDGTLMVIGNFFSPGSLITTIYAYDAYIAGNIFEKGHIDSRVSAWIVGNLIRGTQNTRAINFSTEGSVRILANRIFMYDYSSSGAPGIDISAGSALIAGNILQVNWGSYNYAVRRGIQVSSSTFAKVINNVVDGVSLITQVGNSSYGIVAYGEVSGNIVTNLNSSNFNAIAGSGVENNLCFANRNNVCGSTPVLLDPLVVDRIDYQLGINSPAIDAGSLNPAFADLDRTRNDIGAHGGPWDIAQYDAQRDPLYFGPYVYPMFEANAAFVDGQLQIRAIGVARLR